MNQKLFHSFAIQDLANVMLMIIIIQALLLVWLISMQKIDFLMFNTD